MLRLEVKGVSKDERGREGGVNTVRSERGVAMDL